MTRTAGKVELRLNGQATARMLVVAFVVCGAVATAAFAALRIAYELGEPYPRFGDASSPYSWIFAAFGAVFAAASAVVVKLRQPRGARIEWNEWGFTEWDGDSVRVSIERRKLSFGVFVSKLPDAGIVAGLARAALERGQGGVIGVALTIADDEGRRIYVGMGTQLAWLNDRLSTVADLDELLEALEGLPRRDPELRRSAENRVALAWIAAIIAYVATLIAAMMIISGKTQEPLVLALLAGGVLFGALRALVPLWRAARLVGAARGLTEPVDLLDNEGPHLVLRRADGSVETLDPSPLKHPDAGLALRRGPAWIDKQRAGIETDATRRARRSRVWALRIEAMGRLLLPLAALALLVPQIQGFETWRLLAAGGPSPVLTMLADDRMFRTGPAGIEVVYEGGKDLIGLQGPVDLLAAGPYTTLAVQRDGALVFHSPASTGEGRDLRPVKAGVPASLPRARLVAAQDRGKSALVVTDTGEGQLWTESVLEVEHVATLAEPLSDATAATFLEDPERDLLFIGKDDGSVAFYSLEGALLATFTGQDGPVRGLAAETSVLAVAGSSGVTLVDVNTRSRGVTFPADDIAVIQFGSYPSWRHEEQHGLLVMTADGVLHAVDRDGVEERRFDMRLPAEERPTCMNSDARSIRVGTDHGALYQLWIR